MKMKNIFIFILFTMTSHLISQITIQPECDEAVELPYAFTYNGFLIFEEFNAFNPERSIQLKIDIVEDQAQGNILFTETHWISFSKSGFFSVEIGSKNQQEFDVFVDYVNNNTSKEYYIDVSVNLNNSYTYFGSKKIETVPYALVANALGGKGIMGERGIQGEQGDRGVQGASGDGRDGRDGTNGSDGANGFGLMEMRNTEPTNESFYLDDGTNTSDGKPHIRYFNASVNTWIDL